MATKYVDDKNVTPQGGSRHHGTERPKYPSTIAFSSGPSEHAANVASGAKSRRPGGSMRKGHPFGCPCGTHPCKCGTTEAKKHIIHPDVNE